MLGVSIYVNLHMLSAAELYSWYFLKKVYPILVGLVFVIVTYTDHISFTFNISRQACGLKEKGRKGCTKKTHSQIKNHRLS